MQIVAPGLNIGRVSGGLAFVALVFVMGCVPATTNNSIGPDLKTSSRYPKSAYKIGSGYRSWTDLRESRRDERHDGVDIEAPIGTPVYATEFGKVRPGDTSVKGGNIIVIETTRGNYKLWLPDHAKGPAKTT